MAQKTRQVGFYFDPFVETGDIVPDYKFILRIDPKMPTTHTGWADRWQDKTTLPGLLYKYYPTPEGVLPWITIFARSVDFPGRKITPTKSSKFVGWETTWHGKEEKSNTFKINFIEKSQDEQFTMTTFFRRWMETIHMTISPYYNVQAHHDIHTFRQSCTADISVAMLRTSGETPAIAGYYMNAWPCEVSPVRLASTSEGAISLDVTFSYDYTKIAGYDDSRVMNWDEKEFGFSNFELGHIKSMVN